MTRPLSIVDGRKIEFQAVDSLQKVFMKNKPLVCSRLYEMTALRGETVSFQAAYRYTEAYYSSQMQIQATKNPSVRVKIASDIKEMVHIRRVVSVPSAYPAYGESDCDYITTEPGLFPDALIEIEDTIQLIPYYWRSLWIDIEVPQDAKAGTYSLCLFMENLQGEKIKEIEVIVKIIDASLPKQELIHTEWFYSDCLADYYHIEIFSDEYWRIVENFMKTAVKRGVNMILTPVFPLPLDTLIGCERTAVQLVGVEKQGESYQFQFDQFDRWIQLAEKCGFTYFEIGHLFSQWGAKYAPNIVGVEQGNKVKLFGWETTAANSNYGMFLKQFLKALIQQLRQLGIENRTYFHISDEPNEQNIDTYRLAKELIQEELRGFPIIDALSTYEFYESGIVDHPVPTNEFIHEFLEKGFAHPWVYYCSGEYLNVSNRFFAMPSYRNRIIGVQMYLYEVEGFLHWGYNYYNSQYSIRHIHPFEISDADDAFPSGDSYLVYPAEDGTAIESLRFMVLEEGLNDLRALKKLEELTDKEYVHRLVETYAGMKITFSDYPRNAEFLLKLREEVNRQIEEKQHKL